MNFVVNRTSLYLSCIRLVKVSTSLYIKNYNWCPGRDPHHRRSTSHTRSRRGQPIVATNATGPQTGHLLYVTDWESMLRFLVDTGSEVSIIPPSKVKRTNRQDTFGLLGANDSPIMTYGTRSLTLNLGLCRTFQWVFMIANVRNPILGADFLNHYSLVVNISRR